MIRALITTALIITALHHPFNQKAVVILGDSMVKKVDGFYLIKNIKHKYLATVKSLSSIKTRCMYDYVKPTVREISPEHIILHLGTNDLNSS